MRPNLVNLPIICAMFLAATACVYQSGREQTANSTPPAVVNPANTAAENKSVSKFEKSKRSDDGDFTVTHFDVKNSRFAELDRQVSDEKLLEKAADDLNRSLVLPYDINLRTKSCGESNALYDSADHTITVCFELMDYYRKLFKATGISDAEANQKMFDAVRFAFLHELGHALIDAYRLPVTGNEEDAADRYSAYICLQELGDDGVRAVLAAADAFKLEAKKTAATRDAADEHLLQAQRSYNSMCLIYGSNTEKYAYFLRQNYLPEARAARCQSEYERTVESWNELLDPWRKS